MSDEVLLLTLKWMSSAALHAVKHTSMGETAQQKVSVSLSLSLSLSLSYINVVYDILTRKVHHRKGIEQSCFSLF